jgi:uncharacterized membrane protein
MRRLWVCIILYVALQGALAAWRWHLWTFGTDTGTFAQVVASAFSGFRDGPEQGTHFRFHWAPLLAILYPLIALTRSPLALQFAQIVLISLSALPLYAVARAYVNERSALRYAALALVYPPLAAVAFGEFHEIAFYPVTALGLFWAADRARWGPFALLALAAVMIREEACIVFALTGAAFATIGFANAGKPEGEGLLVGAPREPARLAVAGLGLMLAGIGALYLYFEIIIPHVGAWQPSRFYDYPFAHGPLALVIALALHPVYLLALAFRGRFTYVLEAFVPLALLPLRSAWTLLALPGLVGLLLSSDQIAWRMGSHYAAIWIPWLLLGAIAALVSLQRARREPVARRWWIAALACSAIFLIAFNPMHPLHYLRPVYADDAAADAAFALIPAHARVATHDEWFTRIALVAPQATVFFCPYVDFAVYADDYPSDFFQREIRPEIGRELRNGQMRIVAAFGPVKAYARKPDPGARVGNCITPGDPRYR